MKTFLNFRGNARGSALVGAVAIGIIIAIAGTGIMQITTNSLRSGTAALENDQALMAAESGIWFGARWLRGCTGYSGAPDFSSMSETYDPLSNATPPYLTINGMDVYITVQRITSSPTVVKITAEAKKNGTLIKRVTMNDVTAQTFGKFVAFYSGYQLTDALRSKGNHWSNYEGMNGGTIEGNFHAQNYFIKLCGNQHQHVFKNGTVTIARPDPAIVADPTKVLDVDTVRYHGGYGISSATGHNYNYGVFGFGGNMTDALGNGIVIPGKTGTAGWWKWDAGHPNPPTPAEILAMSDPRLSPSVNYLDSTFQGGYIPNVDPVDIASASSQINGSALFNNSGRFLLNTSTVEGEEMDDYRPTLVLHGNTATYQYQHQNSSGTTVRDTQIIPISPFGTIICANNHLNVYGKVEGQVTIATAPEKSIYPCGNIITSDYDTVTKTIPISSTNMIGLVPGKHIRFDSAWVKQFIDGTDELRAPVQPAANDGAVHISASIVAVQGGMSSSGYYETGTEYWDSMHGEMYNLAIFGNRILGAYRQETQAHHKKQGMIGPTGVWDDMKNSVKMDPRMETYGKQPPGFPSLSNTDASGKSLLILRMRNWIEEGI